MSADSSILQNVQMAFPKEFEYPMVTSLSSGISQTKIRIPAITALPAQTPPSYEIRVEIPELANCFLDPETTAVHFTVHYSGDFKGVPDKGILPNAAGTAITAFSDLDQSYRHTPVIWEDFISGSAPAYLIGDGHNLFNRYSVWLNGNVLTDDIQNPGILSHYLKGMTSGIDNEYGSWLEGDMTLNLEDKGASLGCPLMCLISDGVSDAIRVTYAANSIVVKNSSGAAVSPINYLAGGTGAGPADFANHTWEFSMNYTIRLLGLMGKNNSRMIPMFTGPIRLCFYTNAIENMFARAATPLRMLNYRFENFEFCSNYYRLTREPFSSIVGALPTGVFLLKTGSFAYSNHITGEGSSGQQDYAITTRRAANKFFLITWQPTRSQTATDYDGIGLPVESHLCSVNPNLTTFTGLYINGESYPKQGLDPLFKPMDTYFDNLHTLKVGYKLPGNSDFNFSSWLVSASDFSKKANSTVTANYGVSAGTMGTNVAGCLNLWRPYSAYYLGNAALSINYMGGIRPQDFDPKHAVVAIARLKEGKFKDISSGIADTPFCSQRTGPLRRYLLCNFSLAIDTEISRGNYLSGISTYTGSTFFRANYKEPLPCGGVYHIFTYHDALVAFNPSDKTVAWKI